MFRMKFKIIIMLLIFMFSVNNVCSESGDIVFEGATEKFFPGYTQHQEVGWNTNFYKLKFKDVSYHNGITFLSYKVPDCYWKGVSDNSKWINTDYKIGATTIGSGNIGINRYNGYRMVYFLFNDDITFSGYSGAQEVLVTNPGITFSRMGIDNQGFNDVIYMSDNCNNRMYVSEIIIKHYFHVSYPYSFSKTDTLLNFYLDRDASKSGLKVKVDNEYQTIYEESSFYTTDINFYDVDINNKSWVVSMELELNNVIENIYYNFPDDVLENICKIEVDNIDIGESINVSYFNIDDLRANPNTYGNPDYATCEINLQIIIDRGYYEELIYQDLIINESDNTFYYSSNDLTPGTYYAQINKVLDGLNDYAVRSTFTISELTDYSIIINPDNCYVGDYINLIYKSLNQSSLSIYDGDNKLINNWLNIQGQSQKIYQIPIDYSYENNYSNWYVMLNDTGNVSNTYRYNITVNWYVYTEPQPTVSPTETPFDEDIQDNIDELKNGIEPIKQLIFGISTIFVDNPDYDNNNIVDVNEISTWLNSLISFAIIIFIYILYTVYKRK